MNVFCSRISGVEVLDCTPGVLYRKVRKHAVFLKVYLSGLQIVSVEEDHEAVEARVSRAQAQMYSYAAIRSASANHKYCVPIPV